MRGGVVRTASLRIIVALMCAAVIAPSGLPAQPQYEFANNWITNVSFLTRSDRGVYQNLDDNFTWMRTQGYTHLRFFGIYPNGYHIFPSATLDAHHFPTDPVFETYLSALVAKANQYGIVVNFDGWEVIAESNNDTTRLGVGYIDEEELAAIVSDVLSLGVPMISEEQFGGGFLTAFDTTASRFGALHETTALLWWMYPNIADQQLANVFSFVPYDQAQADSIIATSSLPATLGDLHIWAEGAHHHGVPFSAAVGSFGGLRTENWKNVILFAQLQHRPERFSIEETNWDYLIWDETFNFQNHVGNEVAEFTPQCFGSRPIANLIYHGATLPGTTTVPSYLAGLVAVPAIVNTLTSLGYRVVPTVDSVLPEASAYYCLLLGGADAATTVPLPAYVVSLLQGGHPVFLHPSVGIPDETDGGGWAPVRQFFGLPPGETMTLQNSIPQVVSANGFPVRWGGVRFLLIPRIEILASAQIDTSSARVSLSGSVSGQDVALVIQSGNKFLVNSNVLHLESSYVLSGLLSGPLNCPADADVASDNGKLIVFAEDDTDIDLDVPWPGLTHLIRYNPIGDRVLDTETALHGRFSDTMTRGELALLFQAGAAPGDLNGDDVADVFDVIFLIEYVFAGGAPPNPESRADVNGDCVSDVFDVISLIQYVFESGPPPTQGCAP